MPDVIYLDAAASTPLAPEALAATVDALQCVGNPGAAHAAGYQAARVVARARQSVADLLEVGQASVVFTGSATEANNLALRGLAVPGRSAIVTTAAEHPSVLATVRDLASRGRSTAVVPVAASGEVDLGVLRAVLTPETLLVSVHAANNETGVIQPMDQIAEMAHALGAFVHADASQLMGWGQSHLLMSCDLVTVSSHKMYGPQGAAALIVRRTARASLRTQLTGGGQETGLRSGTLNVAAIAGFGAAAELSLASGADAATTTAALRRRLLDGLVEGIGDVVEHCASTARRLPGILNVAVGASSVGSAESEALLARTPALAASTGSACHAGAPEPSPVLLAMGISDWEAARSIRLSLSRYTTADDVDQAVRALVGSSQDLARLLGDNTHEERYVV